MAPRSRRPAGTSSSQSSSRPSQSDTGAPESTRTSQETGREEVPEVRLLGSLYPLPSREERIAIAAYWRAAKRQFEPGHELDDWLEAEQEIERESDKGQRGESSTRNAE